MSDLMASAADLQLDACLHEAFGGAPGAGLAARIALRLQSATAAKPWRPHLWAAALILGGLGVVAGVAWLQHDRQRQQALQPDQHAPEQDPESKREEAAMNMLVEQLLTDLKAGRREAVVAYLAPLTEPQRLAILKRLRTLATTAKGIDAGAVRAAIGLVKQQPPEPGAPEPGQLVPQAQILANVRDLAAVETRASAMANLETWARDSLPVVFEALHAERASVFARQDLIAVLETAYARCYAAVSGPAPPPAKPLTGHTLIADYSDNRIVEVDDQGRVVFELDEVFGAWDAECLDNGNLLITEFSVSRVYEVDRKGKRIWSFEDLKNPYDADRLPNGNTLIADTFNSRVIEVSPKGEIVWKFDKDVRPFDCDRLANGNTLIADVLKDRVIEVTPQGEIVWEVKGMNNVHDADRLPNGHTLITLRSTNSVIEVDRRGRKVWELTGLSSPSDADRLPNGNTLVAENTQVREFDPNGKVVWKKEMTWAVEANRY